MPKPRGRKRAKSQPKPKKQADTTGADAADLAKKLRQVWSQREAHNVIRAMATKRERILQKKK